ncbi:MAG: cryptochrome/photolyase family protein [Phenylobacterium sp.]|uniref:cryptochrome/photolyase family protein n=1 Tax=Phenylobacterium sp. TaxID=1871053 RepID=UPI0025EA3EEB|nr:cryptochrome/photolyase family protein [Phenylobacterium sp.]MCG9916704.1 cryptochrome/photolyase family protein [Phenylobacterium sp.]
MVRRLILVLGDQLSPPHRLSSLRDADPEGDVVLMAEVAEEMSYAPHHRQKVAMVFAAMRQHADRLREGGFRVRYVRHDDPRNAGSLTGEVRRAAQDLAPHEVWVTRSGEWRLEQGFDDLALTLAQPLQRLADDRYLCDLATFARWAAGRRELRMEFFYRDMRRRHGLLMTADQPAGGRWNFDAENRRRLPKGVRPPARRIIAPNPVTQGVIAEIAALRPKGFGDLSAFGWATNAEEAEALADHFFADILPGFGDHQDAMAAGEPWLWHGRLSAALNLGLLDPLDLCRRAEAEWRSGRAPLNAVEGFIRQILGWREFVRGIYWLKMPGYLATNALNATGHLPDFYWTGKTDMACVRAVVEETQAHAYAHHIQRLMVTGNLAMLLGVAPAEINAWYLGVYADAYEWVEAPNTHGMATYADGGIVGSKPYAASGAYISRMSDYCSGCAYDVKARLGDVACPFNSLYWDFLDRNAARLAANPRMALPYKNLARLDDAERRAIASRAKHLRRRFGVTPDDDQAEGRVST